MTKQYEPHAILFDLDGTLIDSAPGILSCFAAVLDEAGIKPLVPLDDSLIGPPLRKTIQILTGIEEPAVLDSLTERFKSHYDTSGYLETRVYKGVEELLALLHRSGIPLAIATNKRRSPTLRILRHLGWEGYFMLVGSLDTPTPAHPDKASLLGAMLLELHLPPSTTLYVGDKHDDALAAAANGMPFTAAAWGYGTWEHARDGSGWSIAASPLEIIGVVRGELN